MSYDVEFVKVDVPSGTPFPVSPQEADKLVKRRQALPDSGKLRKRLMELNGAKPGPDQAIDYVGNGLNYARFFVEKDRIRVENNCGVPELLKIYEALRNDCPGLAIYDIQSRQLHNAKSLLAWWSRPL